MQLTRSASQSPASASETPARSIAGTRHVHQRSSVTAGPLQAMPRGPEYRRSGRLPEGGWRGANGSSCWFPATEMNAARPPILRTLLRRCACGHWATSANPGAPVTQARWPLHREASGSPNRSLRSDSVRYMYVDTAMHRPMVTPPDTRRDEKETARRAAFPQPAGRFRRWWQVLGSNQRRLSRRFYRPLPLATRATCRMPPALGGIARIAQDAARQLAEPILGERRRVRRDGGRPARLA